MTAVRGHLYRAKHANVSPLSRTRAIKPAARRRWSVLGRAGLRLIGLGRDVASSWLHRR